MLEAGDRIEYFRPVEDSSICELLLHSEFRLSSSDLNSWRRIAAEPLFSELSNSDFTLYCLAPKPEPIQPYSEIKKRRRLQSDNCNAGFGDETDCRNRGCGYVRDTGECNDTCQFHPNSAIGGRPLSTVDQPTLQADFDTCQQICLDEPTCAGLSHVRGDYHQNLKFGETVNFIFEPQVAIMN